jgi:catechol 2,3-dioxygenase-like lactoylglutathione lyase family enzyme
MIQRLSHTSLLVTDQDVAYDFYVNKLGFEVRTDSKMGPFRWLTVGPKAQPDFEIALMPLTPGPIMDQATCDQLRELVTNGKIPGGVFETADCQKTYEELLAKGVVFKAPPKEEFYGIATTFADPFGNWFSLTQQKG